MRSGRQMGERKRGRGRIEDADRKIESNWTFVNSCIKWLMFSFNLLFWVLSWALIGIGIWSYLESRDYQTRIGQEVTGLFDIFFDISVAFMLVGSILFLLAFCGAIGSLRENVILLKTYVSLLIIMFVLEVGAVIAVFALTNTAKAFLQELIHEEGIIDYRTDLDRANFIDWFQEKFECCGVGEEGWRAWESNKYFNCTSPGFEACSVPYSCCKNPYTYDSSTINTRCGAGMLDQDLTQAEASATVYTRGCVDTAILAAQDNMFIIGGIAAAIVAPQLVGIFLARVLWGQIEDQKALGG